MDTLVKTEDTWTVAGRSFRSRLIVGTGKYKDLEETAAAIEASGAEIVTGLLQRRHGSWAGVGQHVRNQEPLCDECREYRNGRRKRLAHEREEAS